MLKFSRAWSLTAGTDYPVLLLLVGSMSRRKRDAYWLGTRFGLLVLERCFACEGIRYDIFCAEIPFPVVPFYRGFFKQISRNKHAQPQRPPPSSPMLDTGFICWTDCGHVSVPILPPSVPPSLTPRPPSLTCSSSSRALLISLCVRSISCEVNSTPSIPASLSPLSLVLLSFLVPALIPRSLLMLTTLPLRRIQFRGARQLYDIEGEGRKE